MIEMIGVVVCVVVVLGIEIFVVFFCVGVLLIEGYFDEVIVVVGVLEQIKVGCEQGVDGYVIVCFGDLGLLVVCELVQGLVIGIVEVVMYMVMMVVICFFIVIMLLCMLIIVCYLLYQYGFY